MNLFLVPVSKQRGLIYLLLALSEAAWLSAATATAATQTGRWFGVILGLTLGAMLLGWFSQIYGLPFEVARFVGLGLGVIGILALTHLSLAPTAPLLPLSWVGALLRYLFGNASSIVGTLLLPVGAVGYIWWRCLSLGQTLPEAHVTEFTLRIGFLGLVVVLVLNALGRLVTPSLGLILLFSASGLLALSMAYTQTITLHHGQGAAGRVELRLANSVLVLALVGIVALALTSIFSFSTVQEIVRWLFTAISFVMKPVLALILWFLTLISPVLEAIFEWLRSLTSGLELEGMDGEIAAVATPVPEVLQEAQGPPAWLPYARFGWRVLVVAFVLWAIYRLFKRPSQPAAANVNQTQLSVEADGLGLDELWAAGKTGLSNLLKMARRFGLGPDLRAAVTIRRIYAALMVLTERTGLSRLPTQTPAEFLPHLTQRWPDLAAQFETITTAYIQVHYGQRPEGDAGLEAVQQAWETVLTTFDQQKG